MSSFYLKNTDALVQATELMRTLGDDASLEAAVRASHNRSRGNVLAFCHWRQIERAIVTLSDEDVTGTVH